jgi:hypothetical protein
MGEFIGGLIGGAIGAAASITVWVLAYRHERTREDASKLALKKALWTDVCSVQDLAYKEAEWWRREMKDQRFGATEERLSGHIQSAVFENNLNRITDIPIQAADALLAMRAALLIVQDAHKVFYSYEEKIIDHVESKKLTEQDGNAALQMNKAKTFHGLCRVAMGARQASLLLDEGGSFEKERQKSFSSEEWAIRGQEYRTMNAALDGMLNLQREGKSPELQ